MQLGILDPRRLWRPMSQSLRLNTMRQPQIEDRLLARERPKSKSVLRMRWEQLLFLHWAWDARQIQKTLPQGLFVDTFDGKGWLAIVPFFMKRVHPRGLPCVPWLSDFLELNVRTYVYNHAGRPGVWFYSLLCNQPLAVQLARRCFHLNYVHTRMNALVDQGGMCFYSARLRGGQEAEYPLRLGWAQGRDAAWIAGVFSRRTLCPLFCRSAQSASFRSGASLSVPGWPWFGRKVELRSRHRRRISRHRPSCRPRVGRREPGSRSLANRDGCRFLIWVVKLRRCRV